MPWAPHSEDGAGGAGSVWWEVREKLDYADPPGNREHPGQLAAGGLGTHLPFTLSPCPCSGGSERWEAVNCPYLS